MSRRRPASPSCAASTLPAIGWTIMRASDGVAEAFDTLITNVTVINAEGQSAGQVGIIGERIAAVLAPGTPATTRAVVDAPGCIVLPGLVDAHAHLREPGLTNKEDFSSGTHA